MHPVAIIFGVACLGAICFSLRGESAAHGMAWVMAALWAAANILWLHGAMNLLPVFDVLIAMLAYALLLERPSTWRFVVATAFAFRMTLHLPGSWGMMPIETYLNWINAAFLAALISISWEGAQRAFIDTFDRVRRLFHIRGVVASELVETP